MMCIRVRVTRRLAASAQADSGLWQRRVTLTFVTVTPGALSRRTRFGAGAVTVVPAA